MSEQDMIDAAIDIQIAEWIVAIRGSNPIPEGIIRLIKVWPSGPTAWKAIAEIPEYGVRQGYGATPEEAEKALEMVLVEIEKYRR